MAESGDNKPVVIASTASPYKFANDVLSAIENNVSGNEFEKLEILSNKTNTDIPLPIKNLKNAQVRFQNISEKEDMPKVVLEFLGI